MKATNKCPACEEKGFDAYSAQIAPFLAKKIWDKDPFGVELMHCKNCGLAFYNPRLEEDEVQTYYENYRGEEYQKLRNQFEPFYTKEFNEQFNENSPEIPGRKENLYNLLNEYTNINNIKSVLDYGGDKGQFIIDQLNNANKYVFEISNSEPIQGVKKIDNYEDCKKQNFDMIMCAHVLEHTSYPLQTVKEIKELAKENTIIYFEVPLENPFYYNSWLMKIISKIPLIGPFIFNFKEIFKKRKVLSINKHTSSINAESIKTLIASIPLYIKRILAFRKFFMHEHVNYFSPKSMEKMLINNGFKNISVKVAQVDCGWTTHSLICCLAQN